MPHEYSSLPTNAINGDSGESELELELLQPVSSELLGDGGTQRGLQERHLSMIALAGMIGTGLFLSSGKALAQSGPLGCVLGFLTMGTVTASIALISAEMSAFKPVGGGFVRHAGLWIDRSCGIIIGWNFWYSMAVTMPAELSAATTLLGFWNPAQSVLIPIGVLWLGITLINLAPVRFYGEFEFYFALLKVIFIITFVLSGLLLDLGVLGGDYVGLRYWQPPFPLIREFFFEGVGGRFAGFWSTMISAAFAYGNVQIVAIAGAETCNPRKSIPAALKTTFIRVVFFYVLSIFVISILVPANDPRLNLDSGTAVHSPFVIAFSRAGIKAVPSIFNAMIFLSAVSSANACTFLASRTLHGLALDGNAPAAFLKLNRYHIPYKAVMASSAWGAVALLSLNGGVFQAFTWLVSLVATSGLVSWVVICVSYLRFFQGLKVQGISRSELPYKSPLQPYLTYYALSMNIAIVITSGWTSFIGGFKGVSFLSNYLNCFIVPLAYISCKIWLKDPFIPLECIDFRTELEGIREESTSPLKQSVPPRYGILSFLC